MTSDINMIKLKSLIKEITDGRGYFTKEKFGDIVLSELRKEFPRFVQIELLEAFDFQQDKDKVFRRSDTKNSDMMAIYYIECNDKEYEVRILNTFKKVPDEELTDRFTMADDDALRKMEYKSLEPKDLNRPSPLIIFKCRVKRNSDGKVLIPKKEGYAILFDEYKTLKETILDIKRVIEKDSGFGGDSYKVPGLPTIPRMQPVST